MYQTDKIKRVVIKIGTSTLTHENTGRLDLRHLELLARVLSDIKNMGIDVVLVTSGAIGVGMSKLGMTVRPKELRYKQAAASVGQCELMHIYDKFFLDYSQVVGQILITKSDIVEPERRGKVEDTFEALFEVDAIPVVNENDTTGVDEILFGDNDTLSAMVAASVGADCLVLLSDIDGLYTADPHKCADAKLIHKVEELTPEIMALAGDAGSALGTGGMKTKLHAAELCRDANCEMVILNGAEPNLLYDLFEGKEVGTRFFAKGE